MVKIDKILKNFFLYRFSVWIPTAVFEIIPKKSSSFELSLSEIKPFSKIRNHDVFRNLNYIYFKLNLYVRIENFWWFLIFENRLISDSDNSELEDFFWNDFKNGCEDSYAESVQKEVFENFVDFHHVCSNTKFDQFFEEKVNLRKR